MSSVDQKRNITLKYPLQGKDGKTIDTLQFGRLKAKQLRLIPAAFQRMFREVQQASEERGLKEGQSLPSGEAEKIALDCGANMLDLLPMVASMAGITAEMADEIDAEDLPAVLETAMDFLSGSKAASGPSVAPTGGVTLSTG